MSVNQATLNLIETFEGLRLEAYQDSVGIWTIGYGHASFVQEGDTCTKEQAEEYLKVDLQHAEEAVQGAMTVDLTDNQYGALVSFCYNVGPGVPGRKDGLVHLASGGQSHLLIYCNQNEFVVAAEEFPKWARAGGQIIQGLMNRRLAEQALFQQ